MGADHSVESGADFIQTFKSDYIYERELQDARLGKVRIYRHLLSSSQVALCKHHVGQEDNNADDADEYENENQYEQKRSPTALQKSLAVLRAIERESPHTLKVIAYNFSSENKQPCSSSSSLDTYHEYYAHTLAQEIEGRVLQGLVFSEQELWKILYSLLTLLLVLKHYRRSLDDLRTCAIYLTNSGEIKCLPYPALGDEVPSHIQAFSDLQGAYLLSPEQLKALRARIFSAQYDRYESDLFAIGLVVLECATLSTLAGKYYDHQNFELKGEVLGEAIQDMHQLQYSALLCNFIKLLVEVKPQDRLKIETACKILEPFSANIHALIPFSVDVESLRAILRGENISKKAVISKNGQKLQYIVEQAVNISPKTVRVNSLTRSPSVHGDISPVVKGHIKQKSDQILPFQTMRNFSSPSVQFSPTKVQTNFKKAPIAQIPKELSGYNIIDVSYKIVSSGNVQKVQTPSHATTPQMHLRQHSSQKNILTDRIYYLNNSPQSTQKIPQQKIQVAFARVQQNLAGAQYLQQQVSNNPQQQTPKKVYTQMPPGYQLLGNRKKAQNQSLDLLQQFPLSQSIAFNTGNQMQIPVKDKQQYDNNKPIQQQETENKYRTYTVLP